MIQQTFNSPKTHSNHVLFDSPASKQSAADQSPSKLTWKQSAASRSPCSIEQQSKGIEEFNLRTQKRVRDKTVNNFCVGAQIGQGTFSKVCEARHQLTDEKVAIKIIDKGKIESDADKVRLSREIKIMRKVRHPNIIQLYQIIETRHSIYLVTQYAARGELFEHIIAREQLTEVEASRFLLQLIDVIEYLHMIGVAHRDLKPENLLLDSKLNLKLTDFGLSNIYSKSQQLRTACGSPCYACPEMLSNQEYDGLKADIWSLGIVLYAMVFGYLPFDNSNTSELYQEIRNGQYEIPQTASQSLVDLLHRILEVEPEQRATVSEIREHSFCQMSTSSARYANKNRQVSAGTLGIIISLSQIPYEESIEQQMKSSLCLETAGLRQSIKQNKHNDLTCTYYLILTRKLRNDNISLINYYTKYYNQINRYAIIEKVKVNLDKRMLLQKEVKKDKKLLADLRRKKAQHLSPRTPPKAHTLEKYGTRRREPSSISRNKPLKRQSNKIRKNIPQHKNSPITSLHSHNRKSVSRGIKAACKQRNRSLPKNIQFKF